MQQLDALLGLLALGFIALLVIANFGCGPNYLKRADILAWVGLSLVLAILLFWAASDDRDRNRIGGSAAAGAFAGVWLGTVSLPVLIAPLAIIGWFRLPRTGWTRAAVAVLIPIGPHLRRGVAVPRQSAWVADSVAIWMRLAHDRYSGGRSLPSAAMISLMWL